MVEPKHIAIILDGNRRFAKRLMAKPWEGHEFGAKKVAKLLKWCMELGVKELTLYAFSLENFHRPRKEFNYLMKLFRDAFEKARHNREIHDKKIDISKIPLDDKKVFELLQAADTTGVFQLESAGMRPYLKKFKPTQH